MYRRYEDVACANCGRSDGIEFSHYWGAPLYNEVLYGKVNHLGRLVHISELGEEII